MSAPLAERWRARIARATALAADQPSAAGLLTFYARLAALQHAWIERQPPRPPEAPDRAGAEATLASRVDRAAVLAAIPQLLAWLSDHAPDALARAASGLQADPREAWARRVAQYLDGADTDPDAAPLSFVIEAALQPFAEMAAEPCISHRDAATPPAAHAHCPFCAARPAAATLHEAGHGSRRVLVCGVCFTEWSAPRIGCVGCGEQRFEQLSAFTAEGFAAVRVDACESCQAYVKTIDLTRDAQAVPIVDDLATVSLDLWANEQGYHRLRPHLLRV